MNKSIIAALTLSLTLTTALAAEMVIAVPEAYPGDAGLFNAEMWSVFTTTVKPGDGYTVLNGTQGEQIAQIQMPDDPKFERIKPRIRSFGAENARIGAVLSGYQENTGAALIDIPAILRNLGDNRLDKDAETDLVIVGNPVHIAQNEPHFSMRDLNGALQIPSDAHIAASLAETPYGTSGRESGLQNVFVHFCLLPDGEGWNSAYDEAAHRFWALHIEQQGGTLVTWTDDIKACFSRFKAKARNSAKSFTLQTDDIGLAMIQVSRDQIATLERGTKAVKDIAIDKFNVFPDAPHPRLAVTVTTGIEYMATQYPEKFVHSWCYFLRHIEGAEVRVTVGTMSYGGTPRWKTPSANTLKAANVSQEDVYAAQEACQFPAVE